MYAAGVRIISAFIYSKALVNFIVNYIENATHFHKQVALNKFCILHPLIITSGYGLFWIRSGFFTEDV